MNTVPLLFHLSFLFLTVYSHQCVHDSRSSLTAQVLYEEKTIQEMPLLFTFKRDVQSRPDHRSIRIKIAEDLLIDDPYTCYRVGDVVIAEDPDGELVEYTCVMDDVLTVSKKAYLIETLMESAREYFESTLSVIRSTRYLTLGIVNCAGAPLSNPVPASYQNPGYDVDFVLFVTARPILGGGVLAFASSCSANGLGRPIAGHANFNVADLVDFEGDRPRQLGIAVHEMTHALGFSSSRFGNFIKWDGGRFERMDLSEIRDVVDRNGYAHSRIITPAVKEAVQIHFGCDSLEGGDIEDGGSSGTAGSHWEKRVFMNEYMTGTANSFPYYSNMTLALLYDSGWYEVDFDKADLFTWGKGAGCAFYEGSCGSDLDWAGYRCTDDKISQSLSPECTQDLRGYGTCNQKTYSTEIPEWFQYFDDPTVGGSAPIADYCTYYAADVACTLGAQDLAAALDLDITGVSSTGQKFEYNSICFVSTLLKLETGINLLSNIAKSTSGPRCYNSTCVGPSDLRVQVDDVWIKCPSEGGAIETRYIPGFGGEITCPKASDVCFGSKYDNTWPEIFDVDPVIGGASTKITITGRNFNQTNKIAVRVEGPCTNVTVLDDETITCNIPDSSYFVGITDLSIFDSKKDVILVDDRGYSTAMVQKFTIQIKFDEIYIAALLKWLKENTLWGIIVLISIITPIVAIIYITGRGCYKPNPPKKQKDVQVHKDDFYDDHVEIDDYYA